MCVVCYQLELVVKLLVLGFEEMLCKLANGMDTLVALESIPVLFGGKSG